MDDFIFTNSRSIHNKGLIGKKIQAYLSVEGSIIFSIILFWILCFFLLAFRLFNNCLESQKNYIRGFYDERFSETEDIYKGVIWGDIEKGIYATPSGIWHINPFED